MILTQTLIRLFAASTCMVTVGFAVQGPIIADDAAKPAEATGKQEQTAAAEIWALEQAYWEFNRDAKHEQIIGSWHDRFLGWPDGEPKPIDKQQGTRYVHKNYAKPASYTFQIEPTGIRVLADVAVNHYTVHRKWEDGSTQSMRITHTWVRTENGWKILGGMSDSE